MAFCINCGCELPEGAKYCAHCGQPAAANDSLSQRKTVYDGKLHKCPNCGELLNSFVANCPSCGYELRDAYSDSSVRTLAMKLEQLESKKPHKKRVGLFSIVFSGNQLSSVDEQIVDLIKNYTIPNTKEDVREFLILASTNIDVKLYGMAYDSSQYQGMLVASQRAISDAWLAKYDQAYQKAKLLFVGTQEMLMIQSSYESKMKEIAKKKRQLPLFYTAVFGGSILVVGLIWMLVFFAK